VVDRVATRDERTMLQNRSTERDASSGNVFRDLGFSAAESERLVVRADLLLQNQKALTARRLAKAQAAKLLHVTQVSRRRT
jgi:predicted XRE-type DNA-binding protein